MKIKKFLLPVVIFFTGAIMLWFNWMTPLCNDDYGYMFVLNKPSIRVTHMGEIFQGMALHYQIQGGRVVAHFLAQLFLLWGDGIFNILNTVAWLALSYGIVLHVCVEDKRIDKKILYFLLSHFLLWLLVPQLAEACLWLDGSANYLWTVLILIYALLPYRKAVLLNGGRFPVWGGYFI